MTTKSTKQSDDAAEAKAPEPAEPAAVSVSPAEGPSEERRTILGKEYTVTPEGGHRRV